MLEATVTQLDGDFRPSQAPAAMLAVQFALADVTGTRSSVVLQRTLSSRVEPPEASPDALVRGDGTALSDVLTQLVAELNAASV